MSSSIRRVATICSALVAALGMGACAAVSGLDALEVCRDATCTSGDGGGGDGTTGDDGATGSDAATDARGDAPPPGPAVTCVRLSDCHGEKQVCCGQNLVGADGAAPSTVCTPQCRGEVLCDPNGANTCGTDTCGGTVTVGGQTLHYCN